MVAIFLSQEHPPPPITVKQMAIKRILEKKMKNVFFQSGLHRLTQAASTPLIHLFITLKHFFFAKL